MSSVEDANIMVQLLHSGGPSCAALHRAGASHMKDADVLELLRWLPRPPAQAEQGGVLPQPFSFRIEFHASRVSQCGSTSNGKEKSEGSRENGKQPHSEDHDPHEHRYRASLSYDHCGVHVPVLSNRTTFSTW